MRNYKEFGGLGESSQTDSGSLQRHERIPNEEKFGLTSQMRRASASIGANLAEGCGRRSDGEMGRYIQIAMGSGAELSYHLLLARDLGILEKAAFEGLDSDLSEVMRMMSALSQKLKTRNSSGGSS